MLTLWEDSRDLSNTTEGARGRVAATACTGFGLVDPDASHSIKSPAPTDLGKAGLGRGLRIVLPSLGVPKAVQLDREGLDHTPIWTGVRRDAGVQEEDAGVDRRVRFGGEPLDPAPSKVHLKGRHGGQTRYSPRGFAAVQRLALVGLGRIGSGLGS